MVEPGAVMTVGMTTVDMLYELPGYPREDTENAAIRQDMVVGGPAGRSAIAAARLGGPVTQVSMIGVDHFADLLRNLSDQEDIDLRWFVRPEPSQNSAILVSEDSGARTTIWRPQPRASDGMLEAIHELVPLQDAVLVDVTDAPVLEATRARCIDRDVPLVVDTGSYKAWAAPLLHGITHIASPEKFLKPFLMDHLPCAMNSALEDQVFAVREHLDAESFCITRGAEGGIVATRSGDVFRYGALAVATVDSCGAGDTFHGGLLWAVGAGLDLRHAYSTASWSAGRKCAVFGNAGIPGNDQWRRDGEVIRHLST